MDDQTLKQLGELLLNAIPTIVIFTVAFVAYRVILHGALAKVLEQRREQTEGAAQKAKADVAAAEAKAAEYETRIREARLQIYKQQEQRRKQLADARAAALQEARTAANARVQQERAALEKQTADAQAQLQSQAEVLAQQIIRAVLKATVAPAAGGRA
jgi:F-type H+-transporting ATPase subunit b